MSWKGHANNWRTTIATALTASATSISLASTSVAAPATPFRAQIWDRTAYPDAADAEAAGALERVLVTALASNVATITRAQEGTTAQQFGVGATFACVLTADDLGDVETAVDTINAAGYAPANNPTFTGMVTLPTPTQGDSSTKGANTAYVQGEVGKTIQAHSAELDDIKNITPAKGDLFVYNGTNWVALTPGTDGEILVADSTQTDGVKWAAPSAWVNSFAINPWANSSWASTVGTWGVSTDAGAMEGAGWYNSSNANGDATTKTGLQVPVSGTYYAKICYVTTTSYGIFDVKVNSSIVASGIDCYSASESDNVWSAEIPLGSLTAGTAFSLELIVNGKNASSSGYGININKIVIYQKGY